MSDSVTTNRTRNDCRNILLESNGTLRDMLPAVYDERLQDLVELLNDVLSWNDSTIRSQFAESSGDGGFLTDDEIKVLVNFRNTARAVENACVALSSGGGLAVVDESTLRRWFLKRNQVNPAMFTDEFALVLGYIQNEASSKLAAEKLGLTMMYFASNAFAEDLANRSELQEARTIWERTPAADKAREADRYAQNIQAAITARLCTWRTKHLSANAATCEDLQVDNPNGLANAGVVDRVMRLPEGKFAIALATTDINVRDRSEEEQFRDHLHAIGGAMLMGHIPGLTDWRQIEDVYFFQGPVADSQLQHDRMQEWEMKGVTMTTGRFYALADNVLAEPGFYPMDILERTTCVNFLGSPLPRGDLAFGKIGEALVKEWGSTTLEDWKKVVSDPVVSKKLQDHVRDVAIMLANPDQWGVTESQKSELLVILTNMEAAVPAWGMQLTRTITALERHDEGAVQHQLQRWEKSKKIRETALGDT